MSSKPFKPVFFEQPGQRAWRTCRRKVAYDSEVLALRNSWQRVYHCPYCGKWHRTSKPLGFLPARRQAW